VVSDILQNQFKAITVNMLPDQASLNVSIQKKEWH
jgi:hypothetical protein